MDGKAAGFTLIEVMFVLAIATIILAIGFPAFESALQRQRTASAMHQLSADMAMARSTALMRRANIVICPRDAGEQCHDGRDWSHGWMMFIDPDGNGGPDKKADILRISNNPGGDALYLPASRKFLRYLPDGRSTGTNLSVHICTDGLHLGEVVVNNLGRIRSARPRTEVPCPYS